MQHLEGAACGTRVPSLPPRILPRTLLLLLCAFAFLFLFSYQSWRLGNRAPICVCVCVCHLRPLAALLAPMCVCA